jgi:SMODS and SLOG-associating 2TM effector domain
MVDDLNMSEKLKQFLERKLSESKIIIKKLKRTRNIYKTIMHTCIILSVVISAVTASVSLFVIPPLVIVILSIISAILTGISARFNFQDESIMISREINRLNKLQAKLDYVVSCNGHLTKQEYQEIIKEFNF